MGPLLNGIKHSFILKVALLYCLLFILMGLIFVLPMHNKLSLIADNTLKVISSQAVQTIDSSLETDISNMRFYTDMLFFGPGNQSEILSLADKSEEDKYRWYRDRLTNMLIYKNGISSAYYFDAANKYYFAYNDLNYELTPDALEKISAYKQKNPNGDIYTFLEKDKNGVYRLCLYRSIIDIYSLKPIGGVMLTFNFDNLQKQLDEYQRAYNSKYAILSEEGDIVISSGTDANGQILNYVLDHKIKNAVQTIHGQRYAVSSVKTSVCNMDIIMISSAAGYLSTLGINNNQVIVMFVAGLLVALAFGLFLTRHFSKSFMDQVRADEHVIAQNEVQLLQAQIKPHFLYNILDAISSLSLMGDSKTTYRLTQELSRFYKINLSSGANLITIKDELGCAVSYINILNIRYDNAINVTYSVDDSLLPYQTIKLILQPLVENAVYHGIRQRRGASALAVLIYEQGEFIAFEVHDDGAGMSADTIAAILNPESRQEQFGLRSIIKKLSIFYDLPQPMTIESSLGVGTKIKIIIRKTGSDQDGH